MQRNPEYPIGPNRKQSGFSLPTVVALGVVAGMWVLGTASIVIPSQGRVAHERTADITRSSAEAALDWACSQLNNPSTRSTVDGATNVAVPSSVMSSSNVSGTISVITSQPPGTSYLYDAQCDPAVNGTIIGGNNWRVMTATVGSSSGALSGRRTVRVILKPVYVTGIQTTTSTVAGPPVSFVNNAGFGGQSIGGNGNVTTDSYDSRVTPNPTGGDFSTTGGDLGTNGTAGFVGNATIGGDLNITSNPPGSTNTVGTATSNVHVNGDITSNGSVSGFNHVDGTTSTSQTNPQVSLPPTPTAPDGSTNLGAISLSGNNSLTLTAGNYIVSSISVAGNAQLNINSSGGPVNIYVQGAGSSAGISLGGNGLVHPNGQPTNLRIWYGGTGNTSIAGNGGFRGVVFAPNSNATVVGNGAIMGAIIGNTVNLNGNGSFHYDRALGADSTLMWNPPVTSTVTTTVLQIDKFQAVSWDEF